MLMFAIYRLTPMALELAEMTLTRLQWGALAVSILYMAYAEGYRGFHKSFSPRVVARANYLRLNSQPLAAVFAPLFCMGFIYATKNRMLTSVALTTMIICFVIIVRVLPQPWRGIVDAGVVTGLVLGIFSILYYLLQSFTNPRSLDYPLEVPGVPATKSQT